MARILFGYDQIEVACPGLVEGRLGFTLDHFDPDLGVACGHPGQGVGHQRQRRRLEDGDPHRAGHRGQRGREIGLRLLQRLQQLGGVGHQDFGLGRQLHAAPRFPE